jgi:enamine deaminase RidA (YjgF/YER057c/UK114 family)
MSDRVDFFDDIEELQKDVGFTQAIRVGDMVYLSGTAALQADFTAAHPGDFESQLIYVYESISRSLANFGLTHNDIVREVMYVTDMQKLRDAIPRRKSFYGDGPYPASTGVEVRSLVLPELMIEVEVSARIS